MKERIVELKKYWREKRNELKQQNGAVNLGGTLMLGISMIFIAVGFIFLPISTTATASLLDYTHTGTSINTTDATFTGYTAVLGITPLLILVGFLSASVVTGMMGIKIMKGANAASANPGSLLLVGLSIVFIGIGLIIEPVMLDGVSSTYDAVYSTLSSYTGYGSLLLISPLLVHIGFLAAAVLSGFFGIKKLGSSVDSGD